MFKSHKLFIISQLNQWFSFKNTIIFIIYIIKNFFINLPEYQKLKILNNKIDPRIKKESSNALPSVLKNIEHAIDQSKQKSTKSNIINKNTGNIKFENNLENQKSLNLLDLITL